MIETIISFHLLSVNWIPLELNRSKSEDWARCCMVTKWALVGEGFGETTRGNWEDLIFLRLSAPQLPQFLPFPCSLVIPCGCLPRPSSLISFATIIWNFAQRFGEVLPDIPKAAALETTSSPDCGVSFGTDTPSKHTLRSLWVFKASLFCLENLSGTYLLVGTLPWPGFLAVITIGLRGKCIFFERHQSKEKLTNGHFKRLAASVEVRSNEGLTLETAAFQIFHGGNSTFISIDHFQITFGLFFKASPGAHLFIWKLTFIHMQMKTRGQR